MALTSEQIELLSTIAIKESIALTDFLQPKVNEGDKEVSWDGFIYIFDNKACTKDTLKGRLAVQVKGKECKTLCKKEISYPMAIADLRNYLNDGGIILFVVQLAEEGKQKKIFYAELTPIKLKIILKHIKKGQKSKSIQLSPFPTSSSKKASIVMNCYNNCKKQQSFANANLPTIQELQKQGVLESITIPLTTLPGEDPQTVLLNNEVYAYANIKGSAIPQPLEMIPIQKQTRETKNVSVKIDGKEFYSSVTSIRTATETKFQLGNSFTLTVGDEKGKSKIKYTNSPYLRVLEKDLDFILSYIDKGYFQLGEITVPFDRDGADFSDFDIEEQRKRLTEVRDIVKVLDTLNCNEDLNLVELSDLDLRTLKRLVDALIYNKPVYGLKENAPLVVKMSVGKLNFAVCLQKYDPDKKTYILTDFFNSELLVASDNSEGEKFDCSQYVILKSDDFVILNNIRYRELIKSFQKFEISVDRANQANWFLLELIEAYDKCAKKEILDTALDFANWIKGFSDEQLPEDIRTLNYFQVIKRMRELEKDERKQILSLISSAKTMPESVVGAYLLLDQQDAAEIHFENLNEEQQKGFMSYPICHFWKKDAE